ncbi:MAG: hypothetical protein AAB490_03480 [Patescibacteria group bacterium]
MISFSKFGASYRGYSTGDGYYEIALNLLEHGRFVTNVAQALPDAIRPPGLPALRSIKRNTI